MNLSQSWKLNNPMPVDFHASFQHLYRQLNRLQKCFLYELRQLYIKLCFKKGLGVKIAKGKYV